MQVYKNCRVRSTILIAAAIRKRHRFLTRAFNPCQILVLLCAFIS